VISSSQRAPPTQHTANTTDEHSCASVGFEPAIPAIKRLQSCASDLTTTGTGCYMTLFTTNFVSCNLSSVILFFMNSCFDVPSGSKCVAWWKKKILFSNKRYLCLTTFLYYSYLQNTKRCHTYKIKLHI
jgi:hypothetical protein